MPPRATPSPETLNEPITIGKTRVDPGRKMRIELPFARVPTGSVESLPVAVINGRSSGPNVWISAAVHGDELNGIEIVRLVLRRLEAKTLRGALIAVPIVNPLGFMNESRYLPDRRDLNRSFPGSARGSTAARLADLFMNEVVSHCSVGIDLHTATNHRTNTPQLRADLDDHTTLRLVKAFGAPFAIHAKQRKGSLRAAAVEAGKTALLYEAGQAHRFEDEAIKPGVAGIMRTLRSLGMIDARLPRAAPTRLIRRTRWMRARRGGLAEMLVRLGEHVEVGQPVTDISDAFSTRPTTVKATEAGWVIARTLRPLVNAGDALVHIAASMGPDSDEPAERST